MNIACIVTSLNTYGHVAIQLYAAGVTRYPKQTNKKRKKEGKSLPGNI